MQKPGDVQNEIVWQVQKTHVAPGNKRWMGTRTGQLRKRKAHHFVFHTMRCHDAANVQQRKHAVKGVTATAPRRVRFSARYGAVEKSASTYTPWTVPMGGRC